MRLESTHPLYNILLISTTEILQISMTHKAHTRSHVFTSIAIILINNIIMAYKNDNDSLISS